MSHEPCWNQIEFPIWTTGDLKISVNEFSDDPVWLEINVCDECGWQAERMSPEKAREFAAKLIECADAVDKAGKCNAA